MIQLLSSSESIKPQHRSISGVQSHSKGLYPIEITWSGGKQVCCIVSYTLSNVVAAVLKKYTGS